MFEGDLQAIDLYLVSGQSRSTRGPEVVVEKTPSIPRALHDPEDLDEDHDEADGNNISGETPVYGRRRIVQP